MAELTKASRKPFAELFTERYLSADPRWLGVFRILFGILLCVDVTNRFLRVREYYSNEGFLPNHFSLFRPMTSHLFSIFHAFSTPNEVRVAFALTFVVFALYTLGFKTKLMQFLSAIAIISLDSRNLMVENGGNVVVNLVAIWTLFLPLGKRFSVDAVIASMRARKEQTSEELNDRTNPVRETLPFVSLVVLCLILQWSVIYFFNTVHKTGVGWRDGSALHWFLHQDRIVTALGVWIRDNVPFSVLRFFTRSTLFVEGGLAFILLVPIWQTWLRRIAFLMAIGLHGNIALTSRLGPFSYVMVMVFVLFFGERDWQLVSRWFGRPARAKTVIYDSDCGICLWLSRLLKRLDVFDRLTFVGNHELDKIPESVDRTLLDRTLVVIDAKGRMHVEQRAVFEVGRALPFGILGVWWLRVPLLEQLGRLGYRKVADNRLQISVWFGFGACGIPTRTTLATQSELPGAEERETISMALENRRSTLREMIVLSWAIMSASQVGSDNPFMHKYMRVNRPEWMNAISSYARSLQGWGMFAPEPPYEDGHVVVDARTKSGKKLDPFTGREPDFDPYTSVGWGHDQFWCDYNNRIRFDGHEGNRQHLREYLLSWHKYANRPDDQLVAFDVWWVQDKSPPPGKTRGEPLAPQKLLSYGYVRDSGAKPWIQRVRPRQNQANMTPGGQR